MKLKSRKKEEEKANKNIEKLKLYCAWLRFGNEKRRKKKNLFFLPFQSYQCANYDYFFRKTFSSIVSIQFHFTFRTFFCSIRLLRWEKIIEIIGIDWIELQFKMKLMMNFSFHIFVFINLVVQFPQILFPPLFCVFISFPIVLRL